MTPGYVHVLKHRFRRGLLHFAFRPSDVPGVRRGTAAQVRTRIVELRRLRELSAGQIAEILEDEGTDLSVRARPFPGSMPRESSRRPALLGLPGSTTVSRSSVA